MRGNFGKGEAGESSQPGNCRSRVYAIAGNLEVKFHVIGGNEYRCLVVSACYLIESRTMHTTQVDGLYPRAFVAALSVVSTLSSRRGDRATM